MAFEFDPYAEQVLQQRKQSNETVLTGGVERKHYIVEDADGNQRKAKPFSVIKEEDFFKNLSPSQQSAAAQEYFHSVVLNSNEFKAMSLKPEAVPLFKNEFFNRNGIQQESISTPTVSLAEGLGNISKDISAGLSQAVSNLPTFVGELPGQFAGGVQQQSQTLSQDVSLGDKVAQFGAAVGIGLDDISSSIATGVRDLPADIANSFSGREVIQKDEPFDFVANRIKNEINTNPNTANLSVEQKVAIATAAMQKIRGIQQANPVASFIGENLPFALPLGGATSASKLAPVAKASRIAKAAAEGAAIGGISASEAGLKGRAESAATTGAFTGATAGALVNLPAGTKLLRGGVKKTAATIESRNARRAARKQRLQVQAKALGHRIKKLSKKKADTGLIEATRQSLESKNKELKKLGVEKKPNDPTAIKPKGRFQAIKHPLVNDLFPKMIKFQQKDIPILFLDADVGFMEVRQKLDGFVSFRDMLVADLRENSPTRKHEAATSKLKESSLVDRQGHSDTYTAAEKLKVVDDLMIAENLLELANAQGVKDAKVAFGKSKAELRQVIKDLNHLANQDSSMQELIKVRRGILAELAQDAVDAGFLKADAITRKNYIPHHVVAHYRGYVQSKGYAKKTVANTEAIVTDLHDVINKYAERLAHDVAYTKMMQNLQDELGVSYKKGDDIPEGYKTVSREKKAVSLEEYDFKNEMLEGHDIFEAIADDLGDAEVDPRPKSRQVIVPTAAFNFVQDSFKPKRGFLGKELINVLNAIQNPINALKAKFPEQTKIIPKQIPFKQAVTVSPTNPSVLGFLARNRVGDALRRFVFDPASFQQDIAAHKLLLRDFLKVYETTPVLRNFTEPVRKSIKPWVELNGRVWSLDTLDTFNTTSGLYRIDVGVEEFSRVDLSVAVGDNVMRMALSNPFVYTSAKAIEKAEKGLFRWNSYGEAHGRLASLMSKLEEGATLEEAHRHSSYVNINYTWLTNAEKGVNGALVPFYTWEKWNAETMVDALSGKRGVGTAARAYGEVLLRPAAIMAWNQTFFPQEYEEIKNGAPWMAHGLIIGKWNKDPIIVQLPGPGESLLRLAGLDRVPEAVFELGFNQDPDEAFKISKQIANGQASKLDKGDSVATTSASNVINRLNPALKSLFEIGFNKDSFTGRPVFNEDDAIGDKAIKGVSKVLRSIYPQVFGWDSVAERVTGQSVLPKPSTHIASAPDSIEQSLLRLVDKVAGVVDVYETDSLPAQITRQNMTVFNKQNFNRPEYDSLYRSLKTQYRKSLRTVSSDPRYRNMGPEQQRIVQYLLSNTLDAPKGDAKGTSYKALVSSLKVNDEVARALRMTGGTEAQKADAKSLLEQSKTAIETYNKGTSLRIDAALKAVTDNAGIADPNKQRAAITKQFKATAHGGKYDPQAEARAAAAKKAEKEKAAAVRKREREAKKLADKAKKQATAAKKKEAEAKRKQELKELREELKASKKELRELRKQKRAEAKAAKANSKNDEQVIQEE